MYILMIIFFFNCLQGPHHIAPKYNKIILLYFSFFNNIFHMSGITQKGLRIRANPDIDGWVYKDANRVYKCLYNTETPKHIEDVKHIDFEHPFEAALAAL